MRFGDIAKTTRLAIGVLAAVCLSHGCKSTNRAKIKVAGSTQLARYAYPFSVNLMSAPTPPRMLASGFFALSPNLILTNAHVVNDIKAMGGNSLFIQTGGDDVVEVKGGDWDVDLSARYTYFKDHPDAQAFPEILATADYAVISLKEPLGEGRVATIAPKPAKVGERVAMAGLANVPDDLTGQPRLQRVVGTNVISAVKYKGLPLLSINNSAWHRLLNGIESQDSSQPTDGDSGMPIIDAASGEVVAMTVFGSDSDVQLLDLQEAKLVDFLTDVAVRRGIAVAALPKVPVVQPIVDDLPADSSDSPDRAPPPDSDRSNDANHGAKAGGSDSHGR